MGPNLIHVYFLDIVPHIKDTSVFILHPREFDMFFIKQFFHMLILNCYTLLLLVMVHILHSQFFLTIFCSISPLVPLLIHKYMPLLLFTAHQALPLVPCFQLLCFLQLQMYSLQHLWLSHFHLLQPQHLILSLIH